MPKVLGLSEKHLGSARHRRAFFAIIRLGSGTLSINIIFSPSLSLIELRDASLDQLEDLVQRINLAQQGRGLPGVMWQQPRADVPGQPAPGESTERPASD